VATYNANVYNIKSKLYGTFKRVKNKQNRTNIHIKFKTRNTVLQ